MELNNFLNLVQDLTKKFGQNPTLTNFITNWNQLKQQYANNENQLSQIANQQLEQLKTDLPRFAEYGEEERSILNSIGIEKFVGKDTIAYLSNIQKQIQSNPAITQTLMQNLLNEINQVKSKPQQIWNILQPIKITSTSVSPKEGIVEIIFDKKVQIENISDGKEQFNDWFIILDGYAHLFGIRREDFEIISISKSSPTRIKLKTTIEIAAAILSIIASIVNIEQLYSSDQIMVEQLKSRELASDTLQQQFIKEAEERLSKNVEREINRIVDQKVQEHKVDTNTRSDIVTSFQKGVEHQYNFIVNGGDVKFYLGDPTENEKSNQLEVAKQEVKQLKENLENMKALNAKNSEPDSTATSSETTSTETE
ncbi:MAG TPA: hypothetical protein PKZ48_00005 [Bacteroidia bacterium]|nr:hypothetical protein [Bacteroidia bacterium]HQW47882.1 hypothetical protein [Bacteroidia bacterium]HQX70693.1 hypothetical protein [Bacteroidia bacterium]HQZ77284.1 hypothetical protein [Bacteroidia bacterium]HRB86173.1 hypothetical protein [Bacteroidia bacterium]